MSQANHWKLGLFVVLGSLVGFAGLVTLGAGRFDKATLPFVTFFDESVQGLDLGSPVKFRGVRIGAVSAITVAPDRRHVEITCVVDVLVLDRLGLRPAEAQGVAPFVPLDLRVQLVSSGITGVKFLQTDFFDSKEHPPPGLPFPTPANYIPAASSTLKSIEESVVHTLNEFPEIVERVKRVLGQIETFLDDVDAKGISDHTVTALEGADEVLRKANDTLDTLDLKAMGASGQQVLDGLNETMDRTAAVLKRIERRGGVLDDLEKTAQGLEKLRLQESLDRIDGAVASVDSTSTAVGDLARDANDLSREVEETLSAVREAADSIRRLATTLERDSDMLLKGRAKRDD